MEKILLTGATGYIGKRMISVIAAQGYKVVCCCRDVSRFTRNMDIDEQLIEVIEVDFLKPETLKNIPEDISGCLNLLCETLLAHRELHEPLVGLFHAGGPRPMSLYEIAQVVNRVGGYDPHLLMGCLRHEAGPVPPRAGNVSMDTTKLRRALGFEPFDPWPIDAEHVPTDRAWHFRRRGGFRGSPALLAEMLYRNPARRS